MSLINLYEQKRSALGIPQVVETYEQTTFNSERNGQNDLVRLSEVNTLLQTPTAQDTYIAQTFKESTPLSQIG